MIATLFLLGLAGMPAAQATDDATELQIRADVVLRADGSRLERGVLLVRNGKVASLGQEIDERLPVLEHPGTLTAGLVACQTLSGMGREADDDTRSLISEARLVHAFQPSHSDFDKALAAGITTVVLAPTGRNVAGGLTAVVKTQGTVLAAEGHLALSFSEAALGTVFTNFIQIFGSAEEGASSEDAGATSTVADVQSGGLEQTQASRRGLREPTSFPGLMAELEERFGSPDGAFARAARGELPCFIEAWERHEVLRALGFAQTHRLQGALHGAPLAGEPALVRAFRESGLGGILGPYRIGQERRSLEGFARLAEAGVPLAFALDAPQHAPEGLRLSAALAITAGADPAAVWRALTSDAAKIAGVAARVGSLEPGKDADFCLWSGDPRNLTSRLEAVYVDGRLAHRSRKAQ